MSERRGLGRYLGSCIQSKVLRLICLEFNAGKCCAMGDVELVGVVA